MNAVLPTTGRHLQDHPPHPVSEHRATAHHPVRRVGLLDRLALHIGVALITWSRRPLTHPPSRERLTARREQRLARYERERGWERRRHLDGPAR